METLELFEGTAEHHRLGPAAVVLRGFALPYVPDLTTAFPPAVASLEGW
ncbi:hypothetical protein ACUXQ2_001261 [Cupriavidus metallidurans]